MSFLTIGKTNIKYHVRRSLKAQRRRIVVTPDNVEVIVPNEDKDIDIRDFVYRRRRWIYDKCEEMKERLRQATNLGVEPERLVSGAKILYRGRRVRLWVYQSKAADISIEYRNAFIISKPKDCSEVELKDALIAWLKDRVHCDVKLLVRYHGKRMSLIPEAARIRELKHHWGVCSTNGVVCLNWRLIFAPKPVLEYAIIHELCHLRHRSHSNQFWALVRQGMPNYESCKGWLAKNEQLLLMI
jgi:predicted metal-dependent hydrolase